METLNYNENCWKKECPKIDCRKKKCCCGIKHIVIPADLGDDSKDSPVVPKNGNYCNSIVIYQANKHVYIYSEEGVYTLIDVDAIDVAELEEELREALAKVEEMEGSMLNCFDTVADMKSSVALVDGSYARTLGFHSVNDGGGATYKITNTGTANEMDVIAVGDLYANFVSPTFVKPEMIGAYGDGVHDDTVVLQYLLTTYDNIEIDKSHLVTDTISATSNKVIKGNGTLILGGEDFDLIYISGDNCSIDGLSFTNPDNYKSSDTSVMPLGRAIWCVGNNNTVTNCKIDNYIAGIIFGNNGAGKSQCKAIGNKITNLNGLSTGWVNDGIMSFSTHCIIKDNYVDVKTGSDYARAGICCDIHADYCVIENNYVNGNDNVTADIHVEQSIHCQILHNYCIKPAQQGICISHYNKAIGNYVESGNTTRTGYNLTLSGILSTSVNNTEIKDNTIIGRYSAGYGIHCSSNDYGIISGNKICGENNKLERGINCLNSKRLVIYDNIIQDQLVNSYGVVVGGNATYGTRICNNIVGTCYIGSTVGTRTGIMFSNLSKFVVENNYIDNFVRGIHFNGGSDGVISNNQIVDTTGTSVINTGIISSPSNSTDTIYLTDNYIQTFSFRDIDKGTNSNASYVTNKNKKDFYDNTANAIKSLSINNSTVVIS